MAKEQRIVAVLSLRDRFSNSIKKAREASKNYGKEWERQANKIKKAAKKIEKAGKSLSKNVTAPIVAVGATSIASFKQLNEGYQTIISKTGATGQAAKDLDKTYKKTFKSLYFEGELVGQAIGEVNTQFGLTGDSLQNLATYSLKFAHINRADVTKSIIGASKVAQQFNVKAKDTSLIYDAVTKSAQNTGVETDKIFEMLAKGAPVLKSLNLDFAQSAELMARAEQAGMDSSLMLGYLSKASVKYAKDGKSLKEGLSGTIKEIKNAKSETESLAIASEIFGSKGAVVMVQAIRDGRLDVEKFANAMKAVKGATESTEKEMRTPFDRFNQALNQAKPALAEFGAILLENALPYIKKMSEWIGSAGKSFENMSPRQKKVITNILLFLAAIGPVLTILGKIVGFVAKIWPLLRMLLRLIRAILFFGRIIAGLGVIFSPLILAIGALIAVGVLLYKNWDKVKAVGGAVWKYLGKTVKNIVETIKSIFKGFINFIVGVFTGDWKRALEGIKQIFQAPFDFMSRQIKNIIELWENLVGIFKRKKPTISSPTIKQVPVSQEVIQKAAVNPIAKKATGKNFKEFQASIPHHAKGTRHFQGGLTYLNERQKGEIVALESGAIIYPHDKSIKKAYQDGKATTQSAKNEYNINFQGAVFHVREEADIDRVADKVVKKIVEHHDNRKVG